MITAVAKSAYSGWLGKRIADAGAVPLADGTTPADDTPPDVASALAQQRILQWTLPPSPGCSSSSTPPRASSNARATSSAASGSPQPRRLTVAHTRCLPEGRHPSSVGSRVTSSSVAGADLRRGRGQPACVVFGRIGLDTGDGGDVFRSDAGTAMPTRYPLLAWRTRTPRSTSEPGHEALDTAHRRRTGGRRLPPARDG